jgi:pimeloyl-ACP methyl ester carboxylesterase
MYAKFPVLHASKLTSITKVPLDYTNKNVGRSSIPIIKYPATTLPYKGVVLTNPGGPGDSGVGWFQNPEVLAIASIAVGTNYDLVSWDPRGINNSIPAANCKLTSDLTGRRMAKRYELEKLYGPHLGSIFFQNIYASSQEIGGECRASIGGPVKAGPHMTTATVARDMVSIIDAFAASEDGKRCDSDPALLNYWGISYGTMIGQTFASMFPSRVGKVVLDGVVSPQDYIAFTGFNQLTFSDDVFATFFIYCYAAGSKLCPFATGSSPHDVFIRFEKIVTQLNVTYAYGQRWDNATAVEALLYGLKAFLFSYSYQPIQSFPLFGRLLPIVESLLPNITLAKLEAFEKTLGLNSSVGITDADLWGRAVRCSDNGNVGFQESLKGFDEIIQMLEGISFLAGEELASSKMVCVNWGIGSDYRYTGNVLRLVYIFFLLITTKGPFNGDTKHPVLFVSNTLDPITPIQKHVSSFRLLC